jgi:hypothetical protein
MDKIDNNRNIVIIEQVTLHKLYSFNIVDIDISVKVKI